MSLARVVALGNAMAGDDGAALAAARALGEIARVEVVLAGRPGPGLLDLLDPARPTLLLDVVRLGAGPGEVVELALDQLADASLDGLPLSSHGHGPAQALRLGRALGRPLPRGSFLGIGGHRFEPREGLSPEVEAALGAYVARIRRALSALSEEPCTSTA